MGYQVADRVTSSDGDIIDIIVALATSDGQNLECDLEEARYIRIFGLTKTHEPVGNKDTTTESDNNV